MVALPQIRCQLHDLAKQYDNDGACHNKRNGGKLHSHFEIYCHATSTIRFYYDMHHHSHIALHDRKIASMMFSWLARFLMSLLH